MSRIVLITLTFLLVASLILNGCTVGVSQEQYDSAVAERDAAQSQFAVLQGQIANLNAQLKTMTSDRDTAQAQAQVADLEEEINDLNAHMDDLTTSTTAPSVEVAWDRAKKRHTAIVEGIPFLDELEEMAPWIQFPDKPVCFDSAQVCSVVMVDEPAAYEGVCIVTTDTQQMFVSLTDLGGVTSMICRGGSVDYEITMSRNGNGEIVQEMMRAGESLIILNWIDTGIEEIFSANVNGEIFEASWSEESDYLVGLFSDLASWLYTINMTGGLIKPSDQPLLIIALGELRNPYNAMLSIDWLEIAQRVMSDLMEGVPQTCM
ncbi:hypothetical protein ACFLYL_02680 [Chloroflexota bacterium]